MTKDSTTILYGTNGNETGPSCCIWPSATVLKQFIDNSFVVCLILILPAHWSIFSKHLKSERYMLRCDFWMDQGNMGRLKLVSLLHQCAVSQCSNKAVTDVTWSSCLCRMWVVWLVMWTVKESLKMDGKYEPFCESAYSGNQRVYSGPSLFRNLFFADSQYRGFST